MVVENKIPTSPEFLQREKLPVRIFADYETLAVEVAAQVAKVIREKGMRGESLVIGLMTGNTTVGVYREWVRLHQEEGLDFSKIHTFNMGEYYPIAADSLQSNQRFLRENFLNHVNIPDHQVHFIQGNLPRNQVEKQCRQYEEKIRQAGGIDILLLEANPNGQIGFNEPGTSANTRTRLVTLDEVTRKEAAADFFAEENVPEYALTVGMGTILEARKIYLLATGEGKAPMIQKTVEGEVMALLPTTFLRGHPGVEVCVDEAAGEELTRVKKPWVLGDVEWNAALQYRAVIQLSRETGIPLTKLEPSDYLKHHLHGLLRAAGGADALNSRVARKLNQRIWHTSDFEEKKRVLIFSPHPDDDVICMGGTMQKLVEQKNHVDVAYMTAGSLAVFDQDVLRHLEFIQRIRQTLGMTDNHLSDQIQELVQFLHTKKVGEMDIAPVQEIKRVIRESEAVAAIETLGIGREHAHFLNLPFYQTGKVKKDPIGEKDVQIVSDLLKRVRPDRIFVAGDMTDPHGTHRMCKQAVDAALERMTRNVPEVWLYRGAWQEWDIHEVDVFVPLSKVEARKKTLSIFKHESQKDRAVFPGPYDDREFWQRAEDRNRSTAEALDQLGLQEYYAMEAFVVVDGD